MHQGLRSFATRLRIASWSSGGFWLAVTWIILWGITGLLAGFSGSWLLFINTLTTLSAVLVVCRIAYLQDREARALYRQLDTLRKSIEYADPRPVHPPHATDSEVEPRPAEFKRLRVYASRGDDSLAHRRLPDIRRN
jgi:low affinity Fe/Cu permease